MQVQNGDNDEKQIIVYIVNIVFMFCVWMWKE